MKNTTFNIQTGKITETEISDSPPTDAEALANLRSRKSAIFEAEINEALRDGIITEEEALKIENLRKELNLSEEHSKSLMKLLSEGKKNIK